MKGILAGGVFTSSHPVGTTITLDCSRGVSVPDPAATCVPLGLLTCDWVPNPMGQCMLVFCGGPCVRNEDCDRGLCQDKVCLC